MTELYQRSWGSGAPLIAMHPLGLESSAFEGVGTLLAGQGLRTIAVDLPGFGKTPALDQALSPRALAEPVIRLAQSLETPPIVLGISLGGRVALEAALVAPQAFRAVIPIAPYLPWLRYRFLLEAGGLIDPKVADWLPFEWLWPALRWLAAGLQRVPFIEGDTIARSGARFVYYLSCPATRAAFFSATREMALDPALGEAGFWTRLPTLQVPVAFVWGERDQLVSLRFARAVARAGPAIPQLLLPCVGHWLNGPHHRCLAHALAELVDALRHGSSLPSSASHPIGVPFLHYDCEVSSPGNPEPSLREVNCES